MIFGGGAVTVIEAVAVLPSPAREDTVTESVITPVEEEPTSVLNVQLALAASVAPDMVKVLDPWLAVNVAPPQV